MFNIFTKSKVESGLVAPGLSPVRPSRLDGAWRVYRAIDRALKTVEAERKILAGRLQDATVPDVASAADGNGVEPKDRSSNLIHLDFFEANREGIERASRLDRDVACYTLLKKSLLASFPELDTNGVR
jgi:hypothetical protein